MLSSNEMICLVRIFIKPSTGVMYSLFSDTINLELLTKSEVIEYVYDLNSKMIDIKKVIERIIMILNT